MRSTLVVLTGLPGTDKTTIACVLSHRSDTLRHVRAAMEKS